MAFEKGVLNGNIQIYPQILPSLKKRKQTILRDVIDIVDDDLVIIDENVGKKSNKGKTIEAINQAIFRDVIHIDDDANDSDDLVIIGEKISNKGKTIEAINQVVHGIESKPPISPNFGSAKKEAGSSSLYHANFKDEILRKFGSFKQFDMVTDTKDHLFVRKNSSSKEPPKNWAKRIHKEWKILENSLPDSIFVRVYESRMDLMRAVIIGAEGTPYHDGLFFFDLYLPDGYPNLPPRIYLHNRHASSKLNPNVEPCGFICLSLLNTWSGKKNERWRPQISTILQVLVSIQGLVLTAEPFFDFSGYLRGREPGKSLSRSYNEEAFIDSLWTMIHVIRRPLENFEDFIVGHFLIRAHDILGACKAYMEGAQVGYSDREVQDVDRRHKSFAEQFKNSLRDPMKKLANEFAKIGAMG